jgi:hypothetical protein
VTDTRIETLWRTLYGDAHDALRDTLMEEAGAPADPPEQTSWIGEAIFYAFPPDALGRDFDALIRRLDILVNLGVDTFRLTAVDETRWRALGGDEGFERFLVAAHEAERRVVLDLDFGPAKAKPKPPAILERLRTALKWARLGVDGFGLAPDTPPAVVKLFRAVLDHAAPGAALITISGRPAAEALALFGDGEAFQGVAPETLTPKFLAALASNDIDPIDKALAPKVAPDAPEGCAWLSGVHAGSPPPDGPARLYEIAGRDWRKTTCLISMMFASGGSPSIWFGDEIAMLDGQGPLDRGPMRWKRAELARTFPEDGDFPPERFVWLETKYIIEARKRAQRFFRGEREVIEDWPGHYALLWTAPNGDELMIVHRINSDDIPPTEWDTSWVSIMQDLHPGLEAGGGLAPFDFDWLVKRKGPIRSYGR